MSTYDEVDEGVPGPSSALVCAVGPRQGRVIVIWAEDLSSGGLVRRTTSSVGPAADREQHSVLLDRQ